MPDNSTGEYQGLSESQKKALRRHKNAMECSVDYCRPYFDKFLRMDKLYHGVIPTELECTFSKVVLRLPFSIIQNELPRSAASLFSGDDFFNIQANDPELESMADAAKAWLNYRTRQMNRIFPRIMSTLTRVGIYGTGYRVVTHTPIVKQQTKLKPRGEFAGIPTGFEETKETQTKMGIVSQNVDIWNILPAPNGGMVNSLDPEGVECAEWVHWIDYMTETKLKALAKKPGSNKDQIAKLLEHGRDAQDETLDIDREFREQSRNASSDMSSESDWIERQRKDKKEGIEGRFRCVWTFFRDTWMLIGEGRYVLYAGKPLLDWIPVAKYVDTPDLDNWYGTGLLETSEDIILAYLLTFNFRMDYLATTLHPTKFIRDDIVKANGGNLADFDPSPYGMFSFNRKIQDIQKAIWYDRFPEISPQAFIEETNFKQLLQEVTAQPNYMKGMGGSGTLANETATGIVSLIEEGTARSSLRSINMEYIGLHDELMLTLKWGKKYMWEDEQVRKIASPDGWPWQMIPYDAIDDGYGIELMGTRSLVHKNQLVRNMLSFMPLLINNPNVPNQKELLRTAVKQMGIFPDADRILEPPSGPPVLAPGGGSPGVGGSSSTSNDAQSMAATPAGFAV